MLRIFNMELPKEAFFFLLATIAMISVKMSFTHFHSSSCQGNIFIKIMEPNSPNLIVQKIVEKMDANK